MPFPQTFWITDRRSTSAAFFDLRGLVLATIGVATPLDALDFLYTSESPADYRWWHAVFASHPQLNQSALSLGTMLHADHLPSEGRRDLILQAARSSACDSEDSLIKLMRGAHDTAFVKYSQGTQRMLCSRLLVIVLDKYRRKYGREMSLDMILRQYGSGSRESALKAALTDQWITRTRGMEPHVVRYLMRHGNYDPITRFDAVDYRTSYANVHALGKDIDHAALIEELICQNRAVTLACLFSNEACGVTARDVYAAVAHQGLCSVTVQDYLRNCHPVPGKRKWRVNITAPTYAEFLAVCGLLGWVEMSEEELAERGAVFSLLEFIASHSCPVSPDMYRIVAAATPVEVLVELVSAAYGASYAQ